MDEPQTAIFEDEPFDRHFVTVCTSGLVVREMTTRPARSASWCRLIPWPSGFKNRIDEIDVHETNTPGRPPQRAGALVGSEG